VTRSLRMNHRPYNIVLIDDDEIVLDSTTQILEHLFPKEVITIHSYQDPDQAAKIFSEKDISVLITDIHMPKKSGDTLIKYFEIKDKKPFLIFATGDKSFSLASSAYYDDARFLLLKPFDAKILKEVMDNCIYQLDHWNKIFSPFSR